MKQLLSILILIVLASSCSSKINKVFSKEFTEPGPNYSKAVTIIDGKTKTIYVAGLTGEGDDFETQTRSTFENIKKVLEMSGAGLKDIITTNIYIPNLTTEKVDIFRKIRKELLGEKNMPASTLVGIAALAAKDKLIEIEVIAVIENKKIKTNDK